MKGRRKKAKEWTTRYTRALAAVSLMSLGFSLIFVAYSIYQTDMSSGGEAIPQSEIAATFRASKAVSQEGMGSKAFNSTILAVRGQARFEKEVWILRGYGESEDFGYTRCMSCMWGYRLARPAILIWMISVPIQAEPRS